MSGETERQGLHLVQLEYVDYANYFMIRTMCVTILLILLIYYLATSSGITTGPHGCGCQQQQRTQQRSQQRSQQPQQRTQQQSSRTIEGLEASPQETLPEPESPYTDSDYANGPLPKGEYGGVTTYFHEDSENVRAPEWRKEHAGLYLQNSKSWWKETNTPEEAPYWA
jgi:hypothetical protein